MTFTDALHYVAIGNPVSKAVISGTSSLLALGTGSGAASAPTAAVNATVKPVVKAMPPLCKLAGGNYHLMRVAGLSGASAVILGAIGSHKMPTIKDKGECKTIFDTANRFHFFHSLALMALPMAKRPYLTGTLMVVGTALFSGTLYYRAFTSDKTYAHLAPIGGTCLILAWLTLLL